MANSFGVQQTKVQCYKPVCPMDTIGHLERASVFTRDQKGPPHGASVE